MGLLLLAAAGCLQLHHWQEVKQAEDAVEKVLWQLDTVVAVGSEAAQEDVPKMDEACLGLLRIPALELEVPVLSQCSDALLQTAPCRYTGSVQGADLVIAGHNYDSHFGLLPRLQYGEQVQFVDRSGQQTDYVVRGIERLPATAVGEMTDSSWALTLFTCTYGGEARLAVRCEQIS